MQRVRQRVEMPDDRGPGAFIRRCGFPLLTAAVLGTLAAVFFDDFPQLAFPCAIAALWMLLAERADRLG